MRTELPVCKRCCFCLPLRYGLITWGYIKLISCGLLSILISVTLYKIIAMTIRFGSTSHSIGYMVVLSVVLVMFATEMALSTVFVVGGHMKNVKFLRIYYIYSIVLLGLTIAMVLVTVFLRVISFSSWILLLDFSIFFVNIVIQTYFVLLLRSEIIKLKNNVEFEFTNNAAEAECTMKYGLVDEEKGTEDVFPQATCETEYVCETTCHCNEN